VVHLGDTYHGGSEAEMFRHLVVPLLGFSIERKVRALSLAGNHDLYAGPDGFLGVLRAFHQPGRYFALDTDGWRIACLDTALADSGLRREGRVDDDQLEWLRAKQRTDPKRLIVLSHHMPRSGWEARSPRLDGDVGSTDGLVAWYWGHEHRCATYEASLESPYAGGCVGNGAFLEKLSEPRQVDIPSWFPKGSSCHCFDTRGSVYWPHGFLELELGADAVTETWHVEKAEPWTRIISVK
jgi:hypothetical protein